MSSYAASNNTELVIGHSFRWLPDVNWGFPNPIPPGFNPYPSWLQSLSLYPMSLVPF